MKKIIVIAICLGLFFIVPVCADPGFYRTAPDRFFTWIEDTPYRSCGTPNNGWMCDWALIDSLLATTDTAGVSDSYSVVSIEPVPNTSIMFHVCDRDIIVTDEDISEMSKYEAERVAQLAILVINTWITDPIACEFAKQLLPHWLFR